MCCQARKLLGNVVYDLQATTVAWKRHKDLQPRNLGWKGHKDLSN